MLEVAIIEGILIGTFVYCLIHYYAMRNVSIFVRVAVFLGWCLGLMILAILPIDLYQVSKSDFRLLNFKVMMMRSMGHYWLGGGSTTGASIFSAWVSFHSSLPITVPPISLEKAKYAVQSRMFCFSIWFSLFLEWLLFSTSCGRRISNIKIFLDF